MAEWEDRHIFLNSRPQLLFYRRFFDDILFIWEGPENDALQFLEGLNENTNNIRLEHVISNQLVNFLDVTIQKEEGALKTKVFFKPTARNSYLSIMSGHHPAWIRNIPKGQFLRVRQNCTEDSDYFTQAEMLKCKFVQKGYEETEMNEMIKEVAGIPRDQCFKKKEEQLTNNQHQWGFLTGFHAQYREIESIFKSH